MTRWGKVKPGDVVELKRAEWTVTKAKRKGDRVRVTVTGKAGTFTRDVEAGAKVKLATSSGGPLHDEAGAQRRWAKPAEVTHTKRDAKWATPASDPAGATVEQLLGGVLVAATLDGKAWAVPFVDLTTVRAHLSTFHGVPGNLQPLDELRSLVLHRELHEAADHRPTVEHEHTKRVPV